jgi:hypothetical protein
MRTFEFELRSSKVERYFLLFGHSLAFAAVWLSAVPLWGKGLMAGGLAVSLWVWRPKLGKLVYDGERWILVGPGEERRQAQLLPSTWRSRWLTLLHFRLQNRRFLAIPVWRDSLPEEDYRRLQGVLRWQVRFQR